MIHTFPQNSEAWEAARRGKLTSSKAGQWLVAQPSLTLTKPNITSRLDALGIAYKKSALVPELAALLPSDVREANQGYLKKDAEARRNIMCQLIGEEEGKSWAETFTGNRFTDYGNETEPIACESFELETGLETKPIGFVSLDGYPFGASPDRMVYRQGDAAPLGILEVKCKSPTHHVEMLVANQLPNEHRMQVHYQMVICGVEQAWFYGYSPDMRSLTIHVTADSFTRRLKDSLIAFDREYKAFRAEHLPKIIL
jgi:hypothetical protein